MREPTANVLYHISPASNRASIERYGLRADMDRTGYGMIFLTDARPITSSNFDVWAVNAHEAEADPTTEPFAGEHWYMAEVVTVIARVVP